MIIYIYSSFVAWLGESPVVTSIIYIYDSFVAWQLWWVLKYWIFSRFLHIYACIYLLLMPRLEYSLFVLYRSHIKVIRLDSPKCLLFPTNYHNWKLLVTFIPLRGTFPYNRIVITFFFALPMSNSLLVLCLFCMIMWSKIEWIYYFNVTIQIFTSNFLLEKGTTCVWQ